MSAVVYTPPRRPQPYCSGQGWNSPGPHLSSGTRTAPRLGSWRCSRTLASLAGSGKTRPALKCPPLPPPHFPHALPNAPPAGLGSGFRVQGSEVTGRESGVRVLGRWVGIQGSRLRGHPISCRTVQSTRIFHVHPLVLGPALSCSFHPPISSQINYFRTHNLVSSKSSRRFQIQQTISGLALSCPASPPTYFRYTSGAWAKAGHPPPWERRRDQFKPKPQAPRFYSR